MHFRVTVRYGGPPQRYHVFDVEAGDVAAALTEAAGRIPEEVRRGADLVELRPSVEPESREYVGDQ